jgi:chromosomal replication initiator protein
MNRADTNEPVRPVNHADAPPPPSLDSRDTWALLLDRIRDKINEHSFRSWFAPTELIHENETRLLVRVPNGWFAEWLQTTYHSLLEEAKRDLGRPALSIEFQSRLAEVRPAPPPPVAALVPAPVLPPDGQPRWLNPRYTFSSFVVSSCNQFAHAASLRVAEQPSKSYNPLYIYGGVGLGKTHLMQAICNDLVGRSGLTLQYISAEHFMNELINAIRFDKTIEFKDRYRTADVLLIDDVQFLAGKERTQEEFFHTFNALYDSRRQIVLTSDVPPRDIPTLEERLRSRFEWGLITDIQPPDLETKVAILRKKAEQESVSLPHDVALFVASNCSSNIRELEGSLIRLIAFSSMTERSIDLDLARQVLKDLLPGSSPAATTESIQKLVSDHYRLRVNQLKSRSNSQQIAFPRQIAMYLCKLLTECSLQEIGRRFGGKHHSTVIHAVRKIEQRRKNDSDFDRHIERLKQSLQ